MEPLEKLVLVLDSLPNLLSGTVVTIKLSFMFLGVGTTVGIIVALTQTYGNSTSRFFALIYEQVFRGVPALVLLLLFYFGLSDYGVSSIVAAVLALGLRSAAFQSQVFRGAIQAIDEGQNLAARSIGMSHLQSIFYIILPQAFRVAIPPYSNEVIASVKDTSFVFVVGIIELMRQGRYIVARTFGNSLLIYSTIAVIYFLLFCIFTALLHLLARRLAIPGHDGLETTGGNK